MGPLFEVLAFWWWTAPAAAGLGAVGYAGLTTGRRRSRRLALDAARVEEQAAVRDVLTARADTRTARAALAAAQAERGRGVFDTPAMAEARRRLQQAKAAQRRAVLALRAQREHVRAERARIAAIASPDDLPLVRLVREHDAVMGHWLEYETDVESALVFPQMTDPRHPTTAAFLTAMQEAQHLRPPSGATRMPAADFVAYRAAVGRLQAAFATAEESALRASTRPRTRPGTSPER
ncbi:hypothetical protein [Microbacterium sp. SORGH_AS_0888]|uniref:hypothetical protein n=1 Tax=Microbacterium sp. SORGH_AS_0888 TaxID=3041791 RepID=UPI0027861512|nr:hypothetical protein [Microbacterium sp. SORGH_AS_0888]MDQ1129923.1 hypothetical protein [Microbacterium sp. SORGH_AS_0888]